MPALAVANLADKGRCVFATTSIAKGDQIVADSVVVVPTLHFEQIGPPLACYPLAWSKDLSAMVLGVISLVNHSDQPNCYPERDFSRLLLRLVAKRDIEPGEEIVYDYKVPLWFEPKPPSRLTMEK